METDALHLNIILKVYTQKYFVFDENLLLGLDRYGTNYMDHLSQHEYLHVQICSNFD